jgi:flagellar M-ring protein FliF
MYRASVSVDCDTTSGEQNEETFDPTKSVMATSQKTEDVTNAGTAGGIPGSASNLPRPPARPAGGGTTTSRRTENISYESSHLVRKTILPQGGIKRISVAVLLDQHVRWEGTGSQAKAIFLPATPETLKTVRDLIAGMTGFTEERGDTITVESAPFQSTIDQTPPSIIVPGGKLAPHTNSKPDWLHNTVVRIGVGAAAVLVFIMIAGVFFFRRRKPGPESVVAGKAITGGPVTAALAGETGAEKMQAAMAKRLVQQEASDLAALATLRLPGVTSSKSDILVKELRETAKKDASGPVHVLQTWIEGNL